MSKVVPALFGRALSGLRPRAFPLELAPVHLHLVPVRAGHVGYARALAARLAREGIRTEIRMPGEGTVGKRLKAVGRAWGGYYAVVGPNEAAAGDVRIQGKGGGWIGLRSFVDGLRRPQPSTVPTGH